MTKALDAAIRAAEAELNAMVEPGTTITLWSLAGKSTLAAIRAALPAEPPEELVGLMACGDHDHISALTFPEARRAYRALRAHILGE